MAAGAALARCALLLGVLGLPRTAAGAPFVLLGNGGCRTTIAKGPQSMARKEADDLGHCQKMCCQVPKASQSSATHFVGNP